MLAGILAISQARLLSAVLAGVFLQSKSLPQVERLLVWFLVVILARALAGCLGEWAASGLASRIKTELRERVLAHLLRLGPVGTAHYPIGDLSAVWVQGIDALDAYISQYLPQIVLAGLIPLGVLAFVFPLDPLSAVILLVTGPLIPFFMFLIGKNAEKLTARQFRSLRQMSAFLLDTLQGLKTLKALGRSREQVGRIGALSAAYRDSTLAVLRVAFLSALALELLGTISTAVIAVQVGLRLLAGRIYFEQAFFLLVIAPDFYLPLRYLGVRFHAGMQGVSAAKKIFAILESQELVPAEPASARPVPADWDAVDFEAVSFRYAGRTDFALDRLNMKIKRGEMTALVGESGAGKTTAAYLALRLISPGDGCIRVGSVRLDEIKTTDWQRVTTWVSQRPHIANQTIGDYLRIAKSDAVDDDLWQALELARLGETVRKIPLRLKTRLGVGGMRLSSGQAQRLSLARAFLRDAPFLVLDEPTAHLDPEEAELIDKTLWRLSQERTVLVIAHRLGTVFRANQIVVMANGKAVEAGTHQDLLARGVFYPGFIASYGAGV